MTEIAPETKIGERYRIEKALGIGGMADVYLAWDEALHRRVALKLIAEYGARHPAFVTRFLEEARTLARLEHPGIVGVYEISRHENRPFLVMKYIEGKSLQETLASDGPLSPERTSRLLADLASAVDYAHSAGVVHRDIKSSNVMISADGRAILTDFGVAGTIAKALLTDNPQLTPSGLNAGTPAYSSPEQIKYAIVTQPSDIYSLGVVVYEALAGRLPFVGTDLAQLVLQIMTEQPPPLTSFNVDAQISAVVERAMQKDPAARYETAREFERAFARALGQSPPVPAEERPPVRKEPAKLEYETEATQLAPALIIYLLDLSRSMANAAGGGTRLDLVKDNLKLGLQEIVSRSLKGEHVSPRYKVVLLGYSDVVHDLFLGRVFSPESVVVKNSFEIARDARVDDLHFVAARITNTA
ncbi:MAG TPA: serine/threonine-protein kinase, partial [Chloroflexota bacterium]